MEHELTMLESMAQRAGKVAAVGSTPRVQHLNQLYHSSKPFLDLHRARVFTEVYKETEGEDELTRRYKAFAKLYSTLPPVIYPDERIAMWQGPAPRCAQVFIEIQSSWIHDEDLDALPTRPYDPFDITEEAKEELRTELIPYWYHKTAMHTWKASTPDWERVGCTGVVDVMNYFNAGTHFCPDFYALVEHGLKGYEDKIRECLANIDWLDPKDVGKKEFYEGLLLVIDGIRQMGENYARHAETLAADAEPVRKKELLEMAEVCRRVPYYAPRNFYEGIQMCWTMLMILMLEGVGPGMVLGRVDQYLYPLYQKDVAEGRLTPEGAMEYIEEMYIKITQVPFFTSAHNAKWGSGYFRFNNLTLGGIDIHGNDATNELSYLFLRAMRHVRTMGPSVSLFVGPKTPDSLILEGAKLAAEGMGHPSFFSVDVNQRMLEYRASGPCGKSVLPLEEIRKEGTVVGCVEPEAMGDNYGHNASCLINFASLLLITLNNGIMPKGAGNASYMGEMLGIETGDPRTFTDISQLKEAFFKQLKYAMDYGDKELLRIEKLLMEKYPFPVMSITAKGCIEKGIDVARGGAICNKGPNFCCEGVADFADSMAAIQKLVFEEKKLTMDQVIQACTANFEGYENIRLMLDACPKYGNDDDYVDHYAVELLEEYTRIGRSYHNLRGAYTDAGIQAAQVNVTLGLMTPATPNGRFDTTPLADAMSAAPRADKSGPTAALNSYAKINYEQMSNGTLLNMWINRNELIEAD